MSNAFSHDAKEVKDRVNGSDLPKRFKNKLISDLSYLESLEELPMTALILFGSAARGELKETSDLDLLLISDEKWEPLLRSDIRSELAEEIEEVRTDTVFYVLNVFNSAVSFFARNVKRDGKILWRLKDDR